MTREHVRRILRHHQEALNRHDVQTLTKFENLAPGSYGDEY